MMLPKYYRCDANWFGARLLMEDLILISIQTGCKLPLPCGVKNIKGFTINNYDFLFLENSGCKLIKWVRGGQKVETIVLDKKYLCICYDCRENCYWGIAEGEPQRIYKLNTCFHETSCIGFNVACQQRAIGLCCDECGNGIWVCYRHELALVEKCSQKVTWYKSEDCRKTNLGILRQCGYGVNCDCESGHQVADPKSTDCRQVMEVMSPCCEESIKICVSEEQKLVGIAACPRRPEDDNCNFCVLLTKNYSHEFVIIEYCVKISSKQMDNCGSCPPNPCPPNPCPPNPNGGGSYEVMHSIALEEAGIAHILNAEGEKIQKAVATSDNIEQLICVNESVKRTLTQVTLLEGMLYSKLEAIVYSEDYCQDHENCYKPRQCK